MRFSTGRHRTGLLALGAPFGSGRTVLPAFRTVLPATPSLLQATRSFLLAGCLVVFPVGVLSEANRTLQASEPPCVHFDVPQVVACRIVEGPDSSAPGLAEADGPTRESADGRMWVEANFDVSTLIRFGQEDSVAQILFVIENPARSSRVVEFGPRTELTTSYVGHIERTRQSDSSESSGVNASFSPHPSVSAQANANGNSSASESARYQQLPPKELLSASGTTARGSGVYYKFRANDQTTLEGTRSLHIVFSVPLAWRADYVFVRCAAFSDELAGDRGRGQPRRCGTADFLVPLYLAGDHAAQDAALELGRAERLLRDGAARYRSGAPHPRADGLSDKLVSLFRPEKQPVPERWLTEVLTSSPVRKDFAFQQEMPDDLSDVIRQFTSARWQLTQLNR